MQAVLQAASTTASARRASPRSCSTSSAAPRRCAEQHANHDAPTTDMTPTPAPSPRSSAPSSTCASPPGKLPRDLQRAQASRTQARDIDLTLEVAQHLGDDVARCVAMSTTDGCRRGMRARRHRRADLGAGRRAARRGASSTCSGEPLDTVDARQARRPARRWPIHRPAPTLRGAGGRSPRSSRPASRSSTCCAPSRRAARSACSAARASARPC